jgi:hypothetical protein
VPARLADRVIVLASPEELGLWCTTKGLGEFGLPELQTIDVPFHIGEAWAGAMTGIALSLLERWLEATRDPCSAFVEIPATIELTAGAVGLAYGVEDQSDDSVGSVRLRLDPPPDMCGDSFLTIGPPDGVSGSTADFLTLLCASLLAAHRHR